MDDDVRDLISVGRRGRRMLVTDREAWEKVSEDLKPTKDCII